MNNRGHMKLVKDVLKHPLMPALIQSKAKKKQLMTSHQVD